MSKRFIVKKAGRSVTFTVDDEDAFLLRSYAWSLGFGKTNRPFLQRGIATGVVEVITRVIARPKDAEVVLFADGDSTNLRRSNLLVVEKTKRTAKATAAAAIANKKGSK